MTSMQKLHMKVESQAKQEWEENIGKYKRAEFGDSAAAQYGDYIDKVQQRAQADVPGLDLLKKEKPGSSTAAKQSMASAEKDQRRLLEFSEYVSTGRKPHGMSTDKKLPITNPQPLRRSALHADGATSSGNVTSERKGPRTAEGIPGFEQLAASSPVKAASDSESYSDEFGDFGEERVEDSVQGQGQRRAADSQLENISCRIGQLDDNLLKVMTAIENKAGSRDR